MAKADSKKPTKVKVVNPNEPMGFALFIAWIGALIYFVQLSEGFWGFIVAFLKACVWPAYVLHAVLKALNIN